ncbi:MAG TPA: polysaccharide deacetylase family protein [Chitinophagaceae bacterium]|nr:polysaccharide deacetylase family protein [Chitinophagaceae bacterium]
MIIYSETITARLRYIGDFIGKEISKGPLTFTNNKDEFSRYSGIKISYSPRSICPDQFWIQPHNLLFETGIKEQEAGCFEWNGSKAFFKTNGDLPFDIFAASFYLLSRYEEYLPHTKDMYGRYAHVNSIAYRENFLNIPLVNKWLDMLRNLLKQKFPVSTISHSPFTFLPTYDIDEAWSFKHKQWWRTMGAVLKDLLSGRTRNYSLRRKVLNDRASDPYDSYAWMDELHEEYKLKPRYFFLVAGKTKTYDKNTPPNGNAFQELIRQHAAKYMIGLHPSWQSGDDPLLISKEKETVEKAAGISVVSSRQHYIRFTLPQTFRYLVDAGIKEDFSMGYGSINGFRASVASPFFWYDLEKEWSTSLLLYPFCYMEANSFFEQKLSSWQALDEMAYYYNEVKKVNGTFITIWHNTFLGTSARFNGWRDVYRQFIKEISA